MFEPDNVRTAVMRVPMLADELQGLEELVTRALREGAPGDLKALPGVVSTRYLHNGFFCRRLSPLPPGRFQAYQALFDEHLIRLGRAGLLVVVSEPRLVQRKDDSIAIYAVQPAIPDEMAGPAWVSARAPDDPEVRRLWERLLTLIFAAVRDGLGLDARLHNWVIPKQEPQYLGVAVPLLRSRAGREELDLDIAFGRAPKSLRRLLAWAVLERIRAPYYSARSVALDLIADLVRRELHHHVQPLMLMTNGRLGRLGLPAITAREVQARRRTAAGVDLLLDGVAKLDTVLRRFRGRDPRFLLGRPQG